jgi:uncharacterized protein YbjT (DUF2867 family)
MILVVGATGRLGGNIAHRLLAEGHAVRIMTRPGSDCAALVQAGAEAVEGDLKDPASLQRACAGIATVITTANSAVRGGPDTVETVEIGGNRNLVDAAAATGVGHFIFISALGASEDSPVPFLRGKALAERHLRHSGVPFTILQPNIFLDVWAGMLVLGPVMASGRVTLLGEGLRRHSMIAADDVASFTVACVGNEAARNRTIPLGGPTAVSWRDVVAACGRALGRDVPVATATPAEGLPGLPDTVVELAASFEYFDSVLPMDGIAAEFGVRLTSVDEFMRRALQPPAAGPGAASTATPQE